MYGNKHASRIIYYRSVVLNLFSTWPHYYPSASLTGSTHVIYILKCKMTPFTRRVSHKHSLPKKLAVHRLLYPNILTESWVEGKSVEEKDEQPTERTAALWGLSSKIDSRIWVNFTRNGHEAGVKTSRATTHRTCQGIWLQLSAEKRLTWASRRRTRLLLSGPKSSFQMRASLYFIWKPRS